MYRIDPRLFRKIELDAVTADIKKAEKELHWKPKARFKELIKIMVDADMRAIGLKPIGEGDKALKEKFPNRWWKAD